MLLPSLSLQQATSRWLRLRLPEHQPLVAELSVAPERHQRNNEQDIQEHDGGRGHQEVHPPVHAQHFDQARVIPPSTSTAIEPARLPGERCRDLDGMASPVEVLRCKISRIQGLLAPEKRARASQHHRAPPAARHARTPGHLEGTPHTVGQRDPYG